RRRIRSTAVVTCRPGIGLVAGQWLELDGHLQLDVLDVPAGPGEHLRGHHPPRAVTLAPGLLSPDGDDRRLGRLKAAAGGLRDVRGARAVGARGVLGAQPRVDALPAARPTQTG